MAERRTTRSRPAARQRPDEEEQFDDEEIDDRGVSRRGGQLGAAQIAQAGLRQITELTGKAVEGVTGVEPGDGGWIVGVEVVEDRRVPSSADILATYEAELDEDGDLVSYRRLRRYPRGRGDTIGDT
jgi:gas vesicle protein GvpO